MEGMNQVMQQILLRLDEMQPGTPASRNAEVLPSVSNPASEAPRLPQDERNLPPVPSSRPTSHPVSGRVKPATPNDFTGERMKGRAFLNSCDLYIGLAPHQFADDHAKVMWALSFMKSGRAARFVDRKMRMYHMVGSLPYASWEEFTQEFIGEFCPKNEIQTARTDLETATYFQGSCTVDEYINKFREMVEKARYFEGAHIVLKFCQGLNPKIQDHIACLTEGRPSDDIPKQWYDAAIVVLLSGGC
jgi:hypothetical protein